MERKSWLEQMKEFEHSSQEEDQEKRRKITYTPGGEFWKKPFFLGGLGLILLLFFISLLFTSGNGEQNQVSEQLQEVNKELQQFEDRISAVEEGLNAQEEELLLMQSADSNLGDKQQDLDQGLEKLENQMQTLQKQIASAEEQGQTTDRDASPTGEDDDAREDDDAKEDGDAGEDGDFVYHEVESGENLFRISRRYEISVERLRQLNDLGQDEPLQPGQKLKVGRKD